MDYPGNTVNPPKLTPEQKRERKKHTGKVVRDVTYDPKICADDVCNWCGNKLLGFSVVCQFCIACQFCGLVAYDLIQCPFCGNELPPELKPEKKPKKRIIIYGDYKDPGSQD